ncbi:hypothetical protein RIF29_31245 [Crotalaria pallida]|uniref:TIR domain-containing protein n=1 Tax=Crotalaria pallida TaxID=3830 RepID=A0AAN9EJE4_CROPI
MASNTNPSSSYDVFISFRGVDTRNNFTDHLFAALGRKSIHTFRDDKKLKKGEAIAPELIQAIEGSHVYIVVFSKNYVSSTWCLRELAKIVECHNVSGKRVLPVFYDVDPSEVRKQSGDFGIAFAEYEERFREDLEMIQSWKEALMQVANLSGWDIRDKPEYKEIEKIVEEVTSILGQYILRLPIPSDIVGIHSALEQLEKLLNLSSEEDVRVVGICGMSGIGKTTLATVLYDRISRQYDACCFIDNVSKIYRDHGSIVAQRELLFQTLKEDNLHVGNRLHANNLIRTRLRHLKALIVLDNVDQFEQIDNLSVKPELLSAGSRIIIISRDQRILSKYCLNHVYNVKPLDYKNALQLFCRVAYKDDGITIDYREWISQVLNYAQGHPLAIKVLGSLLFGRDVCEWRSALIRLKGSPSKDIMDVLRIGYDGLEDSEKEIFLDIACLFDEELETHLTEILDFRGFHATIGIRALIDKSLITRKFNRIFMHDLLKELGKSIVREKSPKKPRKWSRLWDYEDLYNVMLENKASKNLEAIVVCGHPAKIAEKTMRVDALSQMRHLKLLMLWNVHDSGSLHYLSNGLGYLTWDAYPFASLPSNFQPDKLVELRLKHSCIKQLWEGKKFLPNLRKMNLSHSIYLIEMPDFSEVPNLEELNLNGCIKLVRIDPSIGCLKKLVSLILRDCKALVSIPENIIVSLSSLETLDLFGCSNLKQLVVKSRHVNHLSKIDSTSEITIHLQSTPSTDKMTYVHSFCPSLPKFCCLLHLNLSFCNLHQIPDYIGSLNCLERLILRGNKFVRLPCSIKELSALRYLNLEHCKQLKYLPELPSCTALPTSRKSYTWSGLRIFDCPNLCDVERCCSMALSWMIRIFEMEMRSSLPARGHIHIIIPGSQIPRWCNKQNVGSSIRMDSSPSMHDSNWIGVACCATFVVHGDPINFFPLYLSIVLKPRTKPYSFGSTCILRKIEFQLNQIT